MPNYVEIAKSIQTLLKKDVKFVWGNEGRKGFQEIKDFIGKAPVLMSPDYLKKFLIFSFAFEDTIGGLLLQKNNEGYEQPIAFMSKSLQSSKLNYSTMEKQTFLYSSFLSNLEFMWDILD